MSATEPRLTLEQKFARIHTLTDELLDIVADAFHARLDLLRAESGVGSPEWDDVSALAFCADNEIATRAAARARANG